jgi:hypothetical protein
MHCKRFLPDGTIKSFLPRPLFVKEESPAAGVDFFAPDRFCGLIKQFEIFTQKRSMSLQKPTPPLGFLGSVPPGPQPRTEYCK